MNAPVTAASRIVHRVFLINGIVLSMINMISAQTPPPPSVPPPRKADPDELVKLREKFTLRALASARMLADQYDKALALLETQSADSADYETAIAVQRRRKALADLYANPALQESDAIILKPADAKISGSITRDQADDTLAGWRTVGSSATWDILKMTPGTYSVAITCSVGDTPEAAPGASATLAAAATEALTGGEIEFSEFTTLIATDAARITAPVKSTGGWTTMATTVIGEVKIARSSPRLMLKVTRLRGTSGLMHLKDVRLTPAHPPADEPDNAVSQEFAKARAAHAAKLIELEKPLVDAYVARLNALGAEFAAKNDDDGAQLARNEAARAARALTESASAAPGSSPGIVSTEGYEEIRDAQFVDDPTNTGDRFLIKAGDKQYSVRLLWVTCPTPRAEDSAVHKLTSAYFGITLEDSVAVGRRAQEFTASYLKDKPLRVLTRWRKDKQGSVLASVHPADVGDLAGILVDNGLAVINPPAAKGTALSRSEENALAALKDRESAAQSRPVPPGAWSFSNSPTPQK